MNLTKEVLDIIKNRRNTKRFTDQEINKSDIETILESGTWAPNHRNTEPWRFVVINKYSDLKLQIANEIIQLQESKSNTDLSKEQKQNIINGIESAPCYIYVFSIPGENPEITEENYGAVCCAIQNMQLTATSMNLGIGWSTGKMAKINNLHSILNVDSSYKIVGVLTVGHPDTNLEKSREDFNNITKWL
tara:strand:+ start:5045 stop:5614 length:570 start_codon:yes stop_codon:yes gene_type:complete